MFSAQREHRDIRFNFSLGGIHVNNNWLYSRSVTQSLWSTSTQKTMNQWCFNLITIPCAWHSTLYRSISDTNKNCYDISYYFVPAWTPWRDALQKSHFYHCCDLWKKSVIISELKVCNVSQLCKAYDHKFCFPTSTLYSTCQFKQQWSGPVAKISLDWQWIWAK